MAAIAVARRYARALFEAARNANAIDQVEEDLKAMDQLLAATPTLARVLRAPTIAGARKSVLVDTAFTTRVSPLTLKFLHLVVARRRESVLAVMYDEYQRLANLHRGVLPVHVTSAVALTDGERDALSASLAKQTGKRIQLEASIDADLMGGMMLRMGDTVVDGSVRTRLAQLRERLLAGHTA